MKKILSLKHWQLFTILIIPMVLNFILRSIDISLGNISAMTIAVIFAIIYLIIFFSWILTIGLYISSFHKNKYRLRKFLFVLAVLFSLIGYSKLNLSIIMNVDTFVPVWLSIIMTLLTFWGIFYTFYSVSRALKSLEIERKAKFVEYILDAILIFAAPIGVWFIQPRLEKIIKNEKHNL